MLFKVISDLHVDINRSLVADMKFDKNAFYLIAGDISGDRIKTMNFLQSKDIQGVFVEGNHLGYNEVTGGMLDSKEKSNLFLAERFPLDNKMRFLENNYVVINDIVIVGCTLYTDFTLFHNQPLHAEIARTSMNDFRYVKTIDNNGKLRTVNPNDYINWFNNSINYIKDICEKFKNSKIVVVTHFVPSIKGIENMYKHDLVTPAYATSLDQFILDRPNIKLWVNGHTHHQCEYSIGDTKVICNPFGYMNENLIDMNKVLGVDIEI